MVSAPNTDHGSRGPNVGRSGPTRTQTELKKMEENDKWGKKRGGQECVQDRNRNQRLNGENGKRTDGI